MQHKRHNDAFGHCSGEGIAKAVVVVSGRCLKHDCRLLSSDCKELLCECDVTAKCCKSDCRMTAHKGIQPC